jgi:hypothetical protein
MNLRRQHKFDRLKKLARLQKADVFSIPMHTEYVADDLPTQDDTEKETKVFTIHQSIAVKQVE